MAKLLSEKVYVGVSAGSMVTGPKILRSIDQDLYDMEESNDIPALCLVDFYILPHLNSSDFPNLTIENIDKYFALHKYPIYALDDQSAICVTDEAVEVISEGKWGKWE